MIRRTQAVYVISVAAELAGMHPQTLRIYERRGLVQPARTQGGNRRYSDADNLTITVPITFAEAALGTNLKVPTLDGTTVTLKLPEGTPSGKVFRVKARGVATKKATGDLLVTVQVAVPPTLSDEQRRAVEAVADAFTDSPRAHLGV